VEKSPEPYQPPAFANAPPPEPVQAAPQPQPNPAPGEEEVHYVDYLDKLASEYSIRSSGIIDSKKPGKELLGEIELLDSSYHLKERMTIAEIRAMGWTVTRTGYGLLLEKEGAAHVARTWPLDLYGRVDQRTVNSLGGSQPKAGASQAATEGTKLTVVNSGKPGLLW